MFDRNKQTMVKNFGVIINIIKDKVYTHYDVYFLKKILSLYNLTNLRKMKLFYKKRSINQNNSTLYTNI